MEKHEKPLAQYLGIYDTKYTSECQSCDAVIECYTQEDRNPEYYTKVIIPCQCGGFAEFNLPVN